MEAKGLNSGVFSTEMQNQAVVASVSGCLQKKLPHARRWMRCADVTPTVAVDASLTGL